VSQAKRCGASHEEEVRDARGYFTLGHVTLVLDSGRDKSLVEPRRRASSSDGASKAFLRDLCDWSLRIDVLLVEVEVRAAPHAIVLGRSGQHSLERRDSGRVELRFNALS
jgi:hypothetical protein